MAKAKSIYQCQACGHTEARWMGKCPDCGQWNTMIEEKVAPPPKNQGRGAMLGPLNDDSGPRALTDVSQEGAERTPCGIAEFDRVLGGGVVPGSVVLIGGDPGIGKSTLLLGVIARLKGPVLYVSGEESPEQIRLRADRMGVSSKEILLMPETALDKIFAAVSDTSPSALIIDSIQTMYTPEIESAPGSVAQVRECAARLMIYAKRTAVPVFIVGHVTKEGAIAGPRVLEHIVDTVLYFEGERGQPFRILRTVKNRFGSTNEVGVFEMTDAGLREVLNPSELFLSERPKGASGSLVFPSIEGTRPLLVEVQALVSATTFGVPRRTSIGFDYQRVGLLVAVMEKVGGMQLGGADIFTNIVGGLKIIEPAADLPVIMSIASSLKERPLGADLVAFGEVGLSGEVRAVGQAELRLREAAKIGFKRAIVPRSNAERITPPKGMTITGVANIREALREAEG